jgi:hypothetical protein
VSLLLCADHVKPCQIISTIREGSDDCLDSTQHCQTDCELRLSGDADMPGKLWGETVPRHGLTSLGLLVAAREATSGLWLRLPRPGGPDSDQDQMEAHFPLSYPRLIALLNAEKALLMISGSSRCLVGATLRSAKEVARQPPRTLGPRRKCHPSHISAQMKGRDNKLAFGIVILSSVLSAHKVEPLKWCTATSVLVTGFLSLG